jgi:selenocysteine lyase/cysteine desulfurase
LSAHPAVAQWSFADARGYLDTAGYGLPPAASVAASQEALEQWRHGTARWWRDWDPVGEDCRTLLARIVGASREDVALLPTASVGVAIVASCLRPGDEVVVPADEFASLLLPLLAAEQELGLRVRRVPFERLAEAVDTRTALVATSHVRSYDGAVQDLDAVAAAARSASALTLVDVTHAAGVLDIGVHRRELDFAVGAGYKHLLCPRGVAFLTVSKAGSERIVPRAASWRAQTDPYHDYFGGELTKLAPGAARFDVSLAWFAWLGALPSLTFLDSVTGDERSAWCVGLASRAAAALGLEPTGSSLLAAPIAADGDAAARALANAGVVASLTPAGVRLSFHLYNDEDDVALGVRALESIRARVSAT